MLINFYQELEKNLIGVLELCESVLEEKLLLNIIEYVLINSINYNSFNEEDFYYKLTFLYDYNLLSIETWELKDNNKGLFDKIYKGKRIDYSGFYDKEITRYIEILPQYKFYFIEDDEKTGIISQKHFRLDFSVFLKDYKTNNILKKICIECDGYHFHSEKERMIRDNQRTRKLLNEGNFQTIRYLSDEIYENFDVKSLLDILLDEKYKEFDYNTKFKG